MIKMIQIHMVFTIGLLAMSQAEAGVKNSKLASKTVSSKASTSTGTQAKLSSPASDNIAIVKMDPREIKLQRCLIELKVPNSYDARVDGANKRVLFTDLKAIPNATFTASIDGAPSFANSIDLGKFMKAASLNRLKTEISEKETENQSAAKPNFMQKMLGLKASQANSKVSEFHAAECQSFLNSVGKAKIATDLASYVEGFRSNMQTVKSQNSQSKTLANFLVGHTKTNLAKR